MNETELIDLYANRLHNRDLLGRKLLLTQFALELKSINSERSNEAKAVRQNEQTQEFKSCENCPYPRACEGFGCDLNPIKMPN